MYNTVDKSSKNYIHQNHHIAESMTYLKQFK